jgi:hypothetical protein
MSQTDRGGEEPVHDVLAAEEFAMPVRDPGLRHEPVVLPEDPTGIAEPHDVLAAEQFAMPAARGSVALAGKAADPWRLAIVAVAALLAGLLAARLLRRR